MRFVERGACPGELDGAKSKGGLETDCAIAHFTHADAAVRESPFAFAAYKSDGVRSALDKMFHGKCAYCESRFAATAPVDVEHYRPKGRVRTSSGTKLTPGYYWLAATWSNLLASCIDCNRRRRHLSEGSARSSGKADVFPLRDEAARALKPGDEEAEEPLLLNPCEDDPSDHLEFIENVIRPTRRACLESVRGRTTIRELGLDRSNLAEDRRKHLKYLETALRALGMALEIFEITNGSEESRARVKRERKELLEQFLAPDSEYLAMTRQRVAAEYPELLAPVFPSP